MSLRNIVAEQQAAATHRSSGPRLGAAKAIATAVCLTAAGVLAGGWSPVRPARAADVAKPALVAAAGSIHAAARPLQAAVKPVQAAVRPTQAATRPAVGGAPTSVCSTNSSGQMVSCPSPLRPGQLPAGASDQATITAPVRDPATLVDTRTWTSSGGNTFPGADVPFGMIQWSPDTLPHRSDGGGYTYGDRLLTGYSLTHLSGPGCPAAGDVPILPMTGPLPSSNPSRIRTAFTNAGEVGQAGYYSARSNGRRTITAQFSATPHAAIGQFRFPRTNAADFLIKLRDSQHGDSASSARVIGHDEVAGSDTTGNFCGETDKYGHEQYTVYFDIVFSRPFRAARVVAGRHRAGPNAVFLTFNASSDAMISAKVAISYVSVANARLNRQREIPSWDFAQVAQAAKATWNGLLGRIAVSGGSYAKTQEFYSLLYKDFLQPNITSDVNRQYRGSDLRVHVLSGAQLNQYGLFSGWDIYHSLAQLQAMLDPGAASDMAQSLINYYAQNHILPQWAYLNLDNYDMTGDPADSIIADYYAFGARSFDATKALTDMLRQATTVNRVRPGEAVESRYGYLPQNGRYGCCRFRSYVSTLLEYDTADFALSSFAAALGDSSAAARLRRRANNWANYYDRARHLLVPRLKNGAFMTGVSPATSRHYTEGDAVEYLWDVPNDYAGLFSLLGGDVRVVPELRRYLSKPDRGGSYARISNEFDDGEQNAPDYARDPALTQRTVAAIRYGIYRPGPDGLRNNDDLGAESSQFIWEMLGMYPENPGRDTLVFASPGFPKAVIRLPQGSAITINAPGAAQTRVYVRSLTLNGAAYHDLSVPFAALAQGATMDWTLSSSPTSWGSAPQDVPPSYGTPPHR